MAQAEWTRHAEGDLRDIFRYIAEQDRRPETANSVVHGIREFCDEYASHAAAGHALGSKLSEMGAEYRYVTHKRWVVLFKPLRDSILVLAVVDGSREYHTLFMSRRAGDGSE